MFLSLSACFRCPFQWRGAYLDSSCRRGYWALSAWRGPCCGEVLSGLQRREGGGGGAGEGGPSPPLSFKVTQPLLRKELPEGRSRREAGRPPAVTALG